MLNESDEIKAIIPHREPFILVDEILEMDDDRVVALKHVSAEEPYFKGHFPSEPVMPGVLIVEALAQAGAVRILSMQFEGKIAYFGRIDKVRFKQKVVPGDTLRLEVELTRCAALPAGLGKPMSATSWPAVPNWFLSSVQKRIKHVQKSFDCQSR